MKNQRHKQLLAHPDNLVLAVGILALMLSIVSALLD